MDLEGPWGSWSVEFLLGVIWGFIALGCSLGNHWELSMLGIFFCRRPLGVRLGPHLRK